VATELRPGVFAKLVGELDAEAKIRAQKGLTSLALVVEKQAKINARVGSHKYRTPTPARPGTGPAVISGTLRRSITHTPVVMEAGALTTRVGMGAGFFPPYGSSRTPSSKYALYLETGLRNGTTYPFLRPAFKFAIGVPADLIWREVFGAGWRQSL
jgi:hypothetical protein